MDEGEPDFLMSLNDTLTCGFGASVLLFIVFVILVALQDTPATAVGELDQARTRSGVSINPADIKSEDPLLVRVRADCDFIKSLESPDFVTVKLKDGREGGGKSCVAIFRLSEPTTRQLRFTAKKPPKDVALVTVLLGAVVLTPSDAVKLRYSGKGWPTDSQQEVFNLSLSNLKRPFQFSESEWRVISLGF